MDLILGPYSDRKLDGLSADQLDAYEIMLRQNDLDLYLWYSRAAPVPEKFVAALNRVQLFHSGAVC